MYIHFIYTDHRAVVLLRSCSKLVPHQAHASFLSLCELDTTWTIDLVSKVQISIISHAVCYVSIVSLTHLNSPLQKRVVSMGIKAFLRLLDHELHHEIITANADSPIEMAILGG